MKKILAIIFILSTVTTFAQGKYPVKQTLGSDSTLIQPNGALYGRFIIYPYSDTAAANKEEISHYPGAVIRVKDLLYSRNQDTTKWLLFGSGASAINNGLISTGGITKVDSTVTINDTIKWAYNGVIYEKDTPAVFVINSADSGYYRRDLIYADTSGELYKLVGLEDKAIALAPKLPNNSVAVTTIDVYGQTISTPIPDSLAIIPNLQQTTDQGNTTTNPIFINTNSTQTSLRITGDLNHSMYLYEKNASNGHWANTGFLFKNDVPDNPGDEWSGDWFRLMMGSTNSDLAKDEAILMNKGSGGMKIVSDSGRITFNSGSPAYPWDTTSHPFKELGAFETNGKFTLQQVDSSNADANNVIYMNNDTLKRGHLDIALNPAPDSSYGDLKQLDGTHKYIVIVSSDGSSTGVSGGGSSDTASNGLNISGSDIQLGGSLIKNTTIDVSGGKYLTLTGDNGTNNISFNGGGAAGYFSRNAGLSLLAEGGFYGGQLTGYNWGGNFAAATASYTNIGNFGASIGNISYDTTGDVWTATKFYRHPGEGYPGVNILPGYGLINLYSLATTLPNNAEDTAATTVVRWTDPNIATKTATYTIQTATNGVVTDKLSLNGAGQLNLAKYGSGTFNGTPAKQLSVTASGDVIETSQPIITTGTAAPTSTPVKIGDIYVDTVNKKMYVGTGNSSPSDWTITN